jgi:hypothetical protein
MLRDFRDGTVFPYGEFECDSSVSYRSVIGFGSISIEQGKREKVEFFDMLMSKYSSPNGRPKSFYPRIDQITVYSLSIETVTGKYQVLPAANEIWPAANKTKTPGAKGIASAVSLRAITEAARLGFEQLYLFTPRNETLYARMGWRTFERIEHNGLPLTLMKRQTKAVSEVL